MFGSASINSVSLNGSSSISEQSQWYELKLTNGRNVCVKLEINKIYAICEHENKRLVFKKSFPFISIEKYRHTSFRLMTEYSTLKSKLDARFDVECSLNELMRILKQDYISFDESILKAAIVG